MKWNARQCFLVHERWVHYRDTNGCAQHTILQGLSASFACSLKTSEHLLCRLQLELQMFVILMYSTQGVL